MSSSDDEVVWGPVTLKEIKNIFKKPSSRRPDRRRTMDPVLKKLKSVDIPILDSKASGDLAKCVEKCDISSAYVTPNGSVRSELNKRENSNYETAFEETKTTFADCLSETLADFVRDARTRPTQVNLETIQQTLINAEEDSFSEDSSGSDNVEQSHISLSSKDSSEQNVIVISSEGDESDKYEEACLPAENVWNKNKFEVKLEKSPSTNFDITNASKKSGGDAETSNIGDDGFRKTFQLSYPYCDPNYICHNYPSTVAGDDSVRTESLEDNVFVSPAKADYSFISDASETDDTEIDDIRRKKKYLYPNPYSYRQVSQVAISHLESTLAENLEDVFKSPFSVNLEKNNVVPDGSVCYSTKSSEPTLEEIPVSPRFKPTKVPNLQLALIDESTSDTSSTNLNTTLDEIEKLLMSNSPNSSDTEPFIIPDLANKSTEMSTPPKDATRTSKQNPSVSRPRLLSSEKNTNNLFAPKDYAFEKPVDTATFINSPSIPTKKTPKVTPLKFKTLIPKPKDILSKSASKPNCANNDTPISNTFRAPKTPSNKSVKSNLFSKNVVSPVAMYIKYSSQAVPIQNVVPMALRKEMVSHQKPQTCKKESAKPIPEVIYKPSKQQIMSSEERLNLPPSINKMIKESKLIRHEKRILKGSSPSQIHTELVSDSELTTSFINYSSTSDLNTDVSFWATKPPYTK